MSQTKGRLALIAGAVALGVVLLLTAASFNNALSVDTSQQWLRSISEERGSQEEGRPAPDPAVSVRIYKDAMNPVMKVEGEVITSVLVDTTDTVEAPQLFGMSWPEPGEYLVSAGLRRIMNDHPEYQLPDRFGVTDAGDLPHELTTGPDDLLVISGARDLPQGGVSIADFSQAGAEPLKISVVIMYVGLVVLLFPVVLLIAISATLGSVQREQRYAALRLVGATSKQVLRMLVLEAFVGAILGYIAGFAIFLGIKNIFPTVAIDGKHIWAENFAVTPIQAGIIALATILLVFFAHSWGMRKIHLSPLGVVRRQNTQGRPHWMRMSLLVIAIATICYEYFTVGANEGTIDDTYILMGVVMGIMIGLVLASPWLTFITARLSARWARRAPTIIGLTYVQAHASRISRSVTGVVLAVFAGSFFLTAISESDEVYALSQQTTHSVQTGVSVISGLVDEDQATKLDRLLEAEPEVSSSDVFPFIAGGWTVFDCQQATEYLDVSCYQGVVGVNFWAPSDEQQSQVHATDMASFIEEVGREYGAATDHPIYSIAVKLRDPHGLEQLRSTLARTGILTDNAEQIFIFSADERSTFAGVDAIIMLTYLVYIGIVGTIVIAIISILVSTYASLLERRRSLMTLRLSGMQLYDIVRMILIETVGPLLAMLLMSAMLGFGTAWFMMRIFSSTLDAGFDPLLLGVLAGALLLAVGAISALTPMMRRITQPGTNRQE
ncbi:FtsX-like permease family protein [Arcanobacterium pinnipediorum]|uniref:ABC transporter permease n=1 Tax=Arcanobacterium pinnipediorum TaxID=1503041 RepID=A0ABY5AHU3_9ACTO|nr:ABC transporter permease [Arcanobacterium pinnipediorum]USR79772.1 ABC transporter permease [Arcanobacterium pinnipediorum]